VKSKYIPTNLAASENANNLIKEEIKALELITSSRKNKSMQDDINNRRLRYLWHANHLNEDQMTKFGKFLDPKIFSEGMEINISSLKSLKKAELIQRLATIQLELHIERGYGEVIAQTLEYLWLKFDGTEYKKVKQSQKRQKGRQELFEEDEKHLAECLEAIRKRIKKTEKRALIDTDYIVFRAEVYLRYPERSYKQAYRIAGTFKSTTLKDIEEDRKMMKDNDPGWAESRLRDFFEAHTGLKAVKKYSRTS
jgi:hypothetical protein